MIFSSNILSTPQNMHDFFSIVDSFFFFCFFLFEFVPSSFLYNKIKYALREEMGFIWIWSFSFLIMHENKICSLRRIGFHLNLIPPSFLYKKIKYLLTRKLNLCLEKTWVLFEFDSALLNKKRKHEMHKWVSFEYKRI